MDQTVEQAQAAVDAAQRALDAAKTADAALQKAKRLGNRPDLRLLITEFKASTKQLG
jgi:hypothetical protein